MLPRSRRIPARVLRLGRWTNEAKAPLFVLRWANTVEQKSRYTVLVPIRVAKHATARNKLRRTAIRAISLYAPQRGIDAALTALPRSSSASRNEIEQAVQTLVSRTVLHHNP